MTYSRFHQVAVYQTICAYCLMIQILFLQPQLFIILSIYLIYVLCILYGLILLSFIIGKGKLVP